jgi:hypothetical protein
MDIVFAEEGDRPRRAHRFIHGMGLVQNLVAIGIDIDDRSGSSGCRSDLGLGHLSSPSFELRTISNLVEAPYAARDVSMFVRVQLKLSG